MGGGFSKKSGGKRREKSEKIDNPGTERPGKNLSKHVSRRDNKEGKLSKAQKRTNRGGGGGFKDRKRVSKNKVLRNQSEPIRREEKEK